MPNNPIIPAGERRINEAVCIDTKRIYDSCVSKDCLEDLRVTFFGASQFIFTSSSDLILMPHRVPHLRLQWATQALKRNAFYTARRVM